jgi:hypothetical protein
MRSDYAEQLAECVHVERKIVDLVHVVSDGAVYEVVELAELVDELPDVLVRSVKDVSAILVDINAIFSICEAVASDMIALFDDKNLLAFVD